MSKSFMEYSFYLAIEVSVTPREWKLRAYYKFVYPNLKSLQAPITIALSSRNIHEVERKRSENLRNY